MECHPQDSCSPYVHLLAKTSCGLNDCMAMSRQLITFPSSPTSVFAIWIFYFRLAIFRSCTSTTIPSVSGGACSRSFSYRIHVVHCLPLHSCSCNEYFYHIFYFTDISYSHRILNFYCYDLWAGLCQCTTTSAKIEFNFRPFPRHLHIVFSCCRCSVKTTRARCICLKYLKTTITKLFL